MNIVAAVPVGDRPLGASGEAVACHRPGRERGLPRRTAGYEEHHTVPVPARILASSTVRLTIGVADPIAVTRSPDGGAPVGSPSIVAGLHDAPLDVEVAGVQRGVAVRCDPLLAHALLGVPMHQLRNAVVDLESILGRRAVRLADQLAHATGWSHRFAVLEAGLAGLRAAGPTPDPEVRWAWRRIRASGGGVRVDALSDELGWSRRHLARRFREQVGVSPKAAARIVRFERVVALLAGTHRGLADVAADTGYADHAHLSREVRALTRWTPTELGRGLQLAGASYQRMSRSFKPRLPVPA
jgi:AraC-like DNA-binding protein